MILFFLFYNDLVADLENARPEVLAQAFMEKCLDQGEKETICRQHTIEMFGNTGLTQIDINIERGLDRSETGGFTSILSKGTRDVRSRPMNKSDCILPNTIYYGGLCHCRLFYDFGEPAKKGCWRCRPKCTKNAICTQRSGCKCANFTIGDGYKSCNTHIPKIKRAYTKKDHKTVFVEIKPVEWEYPHQAFCKFNSGITEGLLITSDTIQCTRMRRRDGRVDVSWDSLVFTRQNVLINNEEQQEKDFGPIILLILIVFLLLATYFMFVSFHKKISENDLNSYLSQVDKSGKL